MEALRVVPKIFYFDTFKEFNEEFKIGKNDLVITNEFIYETSWNRYKFNFSRKVWNR